MRRRRSALFRREETEAPRGPSEIAVRAVRLVLLLSLAVCLGYAFYLFWTGVLPRGGGASPLRWALPALFLVSEVVLLRRAYRTAREIRRGLGR